MRRPPAELGLIAFFVVVLLTATVLLSGRKVGDEPELRPHRSVRNAQPGGWKAFYALLKRQKLTVGVLEAAPAEWPNTASVIVSGPAFFEWNRQALWTEKEATAAIRWVAAGGTLVFFSDEWNEVEGKLGFKEPERESLESPTESEQEGEKKSSRLIADLVQPVSWLPGVQQVSAPDMGAWETVPNDAIALVRYPRGSNTVVCSIHPFAKGKVVIFNSGSLVDNEHLTQADNARFATFLLRHLAQGRSGSILFDEYHQGYQEEGKSLWDIVGLGVRRAAVHLLLVTLLGFWAAAKRFGLPVPLPPRSRTSAEYVTSVADLYRRARRRDAALETLFEQFRRDLCRTAGVESDTLDTALVRRVVQVQGLPQKEQELKDLLGLCRQKLAAPTKEFTEKDLLTLARALEQARKELGIVRRNG